MNKRILSFILAITMVMFSLPQTSLASEGVFETPPVIEVLINEGTLRGNISEKELAVELKKLENYIREELVKKYNNQSYNNIQILIRTAGAKIDSTKLDDWYIYDHYDTGYYSNQTAWLDDFGIEDDDGINITPEKRPYFLHNQAILGTIVPPGKNSTNQIPKVKLAAWVNQVAQNKENWMTYSSNSLSLGTFDQHIYATSDKIDFVGYKNSGYFDFMIYPAQAEGDKLITYDIYPSAVNPHTVKTAGFLFNVKISNDGKTFSGYLLCYSYPGSGSDAIGTPPVNLVLYKLENVDIAKFHEYGKDQTSTTGSASSGFEPYRVDSVSTQKYYTGAMFGTPIKAVTVGSGNWNDNGLSITLKVTPTSIKLYQMPLGGIPTEATIPFFEYNQLEKVGNYFGPIVGYLPHNCVRASQFTYANIEMYQFYPDYIFDVLNGSPFKSGSEKYFVDLTGDGANRSVNETQNATGKMKSERIRYVTNYDDNELLKDGKENNANPPLGQNGETIKNENNVTDLAQKIADYIISTYKQPFLSYDGSKPHAELTLTKNHINGNNNNISPDPVEIVRKNYISGNDENANRYSIYVFDALSKGSENGNSGFNNIVSYTYKVNGPGGFTWSEDKVFNGINGGNSGTPLLTVENTSDWPTGEYTVTLTVKDATNATASAFASFRIIEDVIAPEIPNVEIKDSKIEFTVQDLGHPYERDEENKKETAFGVWKYELQFTAQGEGFNYNGGEYKPGEEQENLTISALTNIADASINGAQTITPDITLPKGDYILKLIVYDQGGNKTEVEIPHINYKTENLAGLTPGKNYKDTENNGTDGIVSINTNADPNGNIEIQDIWMTNGYITYTESNTTTTVSSNQTQIKIYIPKRPELGTFTIDYLNETTSENVLTGTLYSTNSGFPENETESTKSNGPVILIPNENNDGGSKTYYFIIPAEQSAFASNVSELVVTERPPAPTIPADGGKGNITGVNDTMEYRYSVSQGNFISIPVNDTELESLSGDYGIRFKAVPSQQGQSGEFASSVKTIKVTGITDKVPPIVESISISGGNLSFKTKDLMETNPQNGSGIVKYELKMNDIDGTIINDGNTSDITEDSKTSLQTILIPGTLPKGEYAMTLTVYDAAGNKTVVKIPYISYTEETFSGFKPNTTYSGLGTADQNGDIAIEESQMGSNVSFVAINNTFLSDNSEAGANNTNITIAVPTRPEAPGIVGYKRLSDTEIELSFGDETGRVYKQQNQPNSVYNNVPDGVNSFVAAAANYYVRFKAKFGESFASKVRTINVSGITDTVSPVVPAVTLSNGALSFTTSDMDNQTDNGAGIAKYELNMVVNGTSVSEKYDVTDATTENSKSTLQTFTINDLPESEYAMTLTVYDAAGNKTVVEIPYINYVEETFSGLKPNTAYNGLGTASSEGNIVIKENQMGGNVSYTSINSTVLSDGNKSSSSSEITIAVPARPGIPNLVSSKRISDAKIMLSGVKGNMEYRESISGGSFIEVSSGKSEIELDAAVYEIRYKAVKGKNFASRETTVTTSVYTISGEIVENDRYTPVKNAEVILFRDDTKINTIKTDASGSFSFTQIPDGRYVIEIVTPGRENTKQRIPVVVDAGNIYENIVLPSYEIPKFSVYGYITDYDYNYVSGAAVQITLNDGTSNITHTYDDGFYMFENVPQGVYSIIVIKEYENGSFVTRTVGVTVKDRDVRKDIVLPSKNTGSKNTAVDSPPNLQTGVNGLDELLYIAATFDPYQGITQDELDLVEQGIAALKLELIIENVDEDNNKPEHMVGELKQSANNDNLSIKFYIDLTVYKHFWDDKADYDAGREADVNSKLSELPKFITVDIQLDNKLVGYTNYVVYRYHDINGRVDTIPEYKGNQNEEYFIIEGNILTLHVYKFSTYAVAVEDKYTAGVTVNKDGAVWSSVEAPVITFEDTYGNIYPNNIKLFDGVYNIFADGAPVGKSITINGGAVYETIDYYTLTLICGDGVKSTTGGGVYLPGAFVDVNAVVASGYVWNEWVSNYAIYDTGNRNYTFIMPAHALTLTAEAIAKHDDIDNSYTDPDPVFTPDPIATPDPVQYTVNVESGKGGSITNEGSKKLNSGYSATYKITPDKGMRILDVFVDNVSVGGVSSYTVKNIKGNVSIYAMFTDVNNFIIESVPVENGFVSSSGRTAYKLGSNVTYVFTPAAGYYLRDVIIDGISVGAVSSYTFYALNSDYIIMPVFAPVTELNRKDHFAYMIGYPDGNIRPMNNVTREEAATIFFRLLSESTRALFLSYNNQFTDVAYDRWSNCAISTLTKAGIITGKSEDTFAPQAYVTRAEMAVIITRFDALVYNGGGSVFKDISGHWAENEIKSAASKGWIKGYEDGTFRPDAPITRAEAATLINNVLERVPETSDDLLDGMNTWYDNMDKNVWYYLALQEASNSHECLIKPDGKHEYWEKMREAFDWSIYER